MGEQSPVCKYDFFCQSNDFTEKLSNQATVCKIQKFTFTHFWQKFRESILLKRWFHEIFFWWEKISRFSTLWCAHCAIESQNLREMNKLKVCNFHKNKNSLGWNILLEIHSLLSHFSFQQVERAKFIHYYTVVVYLCMREKVDFT